jgi:hypothetical protein
MIIVLILKPKEIGLTAVIGRAYHKLSDEKKPPRLATGGFSSATKLAGN